MKRSLATALTTVVASPLIITASIAGASPANAQLITPQNCNAVYPAGQAYVPATAPVTINVRRGSDVTLLPRLTRGGFGCNNQGIRFWSRALNQSNYRAGAYQGTAPISIGDGFAAKTVANVSISFRWFIQFRSQASNISQVNARR